MSNKVEAIIGLGSNLGEREDNIRRALDAIAALPNTTLLRESALMENPAVDSPQQAGDFLNGAAMVQTTLAPTALLNHLIEIETTLGRVRTEKNAPRTIDLDLLLYGEEVIDEPELKVPHPRMAEREFVLWPLLQIAPKAKDPQSGELYADAYARLKGSNQ
jgi:2-amino-4-hydroxy-6-hydroxymethyldihydropteridine diphosphokinase